MPEAVFTKGVDERPQLPLVAMRIGMLAWIASKVICYPLWQGGRFFPLAPVHEILRVVPLWVHDGLFYSSLLAMLVWVIYPQRKLALFILLAELGSCVLDQNRWEPWEYQFIFMLAVTIFYQRKAHIKTALQLIVVGLYFFSGLGKLNSAFIHDIWNGLLLRRSFGIFTENAWVFRMGYLLPLIEMALALLLLFGRWRKVGVIGLTLMHVFILVLFGPLFLNRSVVIWPWNMLMPVLLFYLFYHTRFQPLRSFFVRPFSTVVLLCWCILPMLHLAGRWDNYLSFTLYSGGTPQLYICTEDPAALQAMAPYMPKVRNGFIPCKYPVSTYAWSARLMYTTPYPEERVFRVIAREWRKWYPGAAVKFYVFRSGFSPTLVELQE